MTHYLCITNELNWEIAKREGIWGVSERHRKKLENVKRGDTLVFYVKQKYEKRGVRIPPKLVGIFKADSKPFQDSKEVFSSIGFAEEELFPFRVKIKPVLMAKKPVLFKELIPKLKFITNKRKWFTHLIGRAMRILPQEDYELIESLMKAQTNQN